MISVIVLTKNEEKNIDECLSTVSWADEVIVIDDNSNDRTVEIAKKRGVKAISHPLNNDFSQQRNFGLSQTKGDWILFVDADERISSALWYEIMAITNDPAGIYNGFYLKRRDVIWGKELKYGETGNVKLLRLARKDSGIWKGRVHEIWEVSRKTAVLKNPIMHYPHQSIKEFLQEVNYYTDLRAGELHKKKVYSSWISIIIYTKLKFIVNYFVKGGIFDGIPGLLFALMMSFHSFLVRGKLWQLWQKKK